MNQCKICIVGMGYVGLTLAVIMTEKGFEVTGVEVNGEICKQLNKGDPHFHENRLDILLKKHINNKLTIREEVTKEKQDVFIICVGTPISKEKKNPIMDYIIRSAQTVAESLDENNLVILRSTVPIGTTREIIKPILDKTGKKYRLAFCPERTAEGNALKELVELPQIISGIDEESVNLASNIFRKIVPTILEVSSLEAAETIKLVNNGYRDLNFAFANEVAIICEVFKMDALELIRAANFGYPRSNIPVPGFVGGACLEKDPYILAYSCKKKGYVPELTLNSRKINELLPNYILNKIQKKITDLGKRIDGSKIFITGFGFKGEPETNDIRGSPTLELVSGFKQLGCNKIYGHDFIVKEELLEKEGIIPVSLIEGFKNADCVIFANNHKKYFTLDIKHYTDFLNKPAVFVDVWRIFNHNEVKGKDIIYGGFGFD